MTQTRPNILILVSEDCPPRLGAYGDRLAQSPNLDRLAAEGVTYDAAFATSPVCAPSRYSMLTGTYAECAPPAQQMTGWGSAPARMNTYPGLLRQAGYYCTNNSKTHYNVNVDPTVLWDETSGRAHWANRPEGAPFLAVFNCMLTHESCVFEMREGAVTPEAVTLPGYLPDLPGLRRDLASYYNRVAAMDGWMGDRLGELDLAGLKNDTVVIYTSDHGSPLPRSKRFCYDDGLRVPMIVRVPPKWRHLLPLPPGSRVAEPVSHVDLLASLMAIAGVAPPLDTQGQYFIGGKPAPRRFAFSGRDRMDERHDLTRTVRSARFRYICNYAPHRPWGQHYAYAWNAKGYQEYEAAFLAGRLDPIQARFWQPKPAEELYDMAADPDALTNLAGDAAFAAPLADLRAALDRHMREIRDRGFMPETERVLSEADWADPCIYPLDQVLDLAGRAARGDRSSLPGYVAALGHPATAMRYWAAQGLLLLACAGGAMPAAAREAFETETDTVVRIPLAEALARGPSETEMVCWLTGIADADPDRRLRLQALEALTALPLHPGISLPMAARAAEDSDEYVRNAGCYLKPLLEGTYTPEARLFRYDLFLKHMPGHSGIGPQSFPDPATLRRPGAPGAST